jgi:hypothetical protein
LHQKSSREFRPVFHFKSQLYLKDLVCSRFTPVSWKVFSSKQKILNTLWGIFTLGRTLDLFHQGVYPPSRTAWYIILVYSTWSTFSQFVGNENTGNSNNYWGEFQLVYFPIKWVFCTLNKRFGASMHVINVSSGLDKNLYSAI